MVAGTTSLEQLSGANDILGFRKHSTAAAVLDVALEKARKRGWKLMRATSDVRSREDTICYFNGEIARIEIAFDRWSQYAAMHGEQLPRGIENRLNQEYVTVQSMIDLHEERLSKDRSQLVQAKHAFHVAFVELNDVIMQLTDVYDLQEHTTIHIDYSSNITCSESVASVSWLNDNGTRSTRILLRNGVYRDS